MQRRKEINNGAIEYPRAPEHEIGLPGRAIKLLIDSLLSIKFIPLSGASQYYDPGTKAGSTMMTRGLILLLSMGLQPLWADEQRVGAADPGSVPESASGLVNDPTDGETARLRQALHEGKARLKAIENSNKNLKQRMKRLEHRILELRARTAEKDQVINQMQQDAVSTGM